MRGSMNDQLRAVKATGIKWPTALELLAKYSADDLDELGQNGGFRLLTDVIWRSDMVIPELPGGWVAIYAGRTEPGATGGIFLMPNTPWTRKLWNKGQFKVLLEDGLNEQQAALFMVSKERHKTRAIRHVIHLLKKHPAEAGQVVLRVPKWGMPTRDQFDFWCSRYLPAGSYSQERVDTILSVLRDITYPSQAMLSDAADLVREVKADLKLGTPVEEEVQPVEEVAAPVAKPKKKLSKKQLEKFQRYKDRVKQLRKEERAKKGKAVEVQSGLHGDSEGAAVAEPGSLGDSAAADPVNDVPTTDPMIEEIRQAMDASDAAKQSTQQEQEVEQ